MALSRGGQESAGVSHLDPLIDPDTYGLKYVMILSFYIVQEHTVTRYEHGGCTERLPSSRLAWSSFISMIL